MQRPGRGKAHHAWTPSPGRFVTEAADLAVTGTRDGYGEISLRELLVQMIEEYARHNGHADLLRERIDGRVGQ